MSQVKERPILFSAPMVRAILDGRKTVTRRPISHKLANRFDEPRGQADVDAGYPVVECEEGYFPAINFCPYGKPGDRLWVREAWQADAQVDSVAPRELSHGEPIRYPADWDFRQTGCAMIKPGKIRPSIHMPRWACRILLEITDVRVERLKDISEQQALAEGIYSEPAVNGMYTYDGDHYTSKSDGPDRAFAELWNTTGGDWDANPWVWVVEFKRVTP